MDTLITIVARHEERDYNSEELPNDAIERLLMAGRAAGSARNRQPCRFTVIQGGNECALSLADLVTRPTNVTCAALLVVVTLKNARALFDAGRACQNMMLAAWAEGIGSCPNSIKDPGALMELIKAPKDEDPVMVLSFGYPKKARSIDDTRSPADWMNRLDRLPEDEVVRRR
jgi:nitroreductase